MEKACSQLLDHLQSLDDAKRSDGLAQFSLTWNSESAELSSSLANSLLLGTTDRNGLLVACGRGQLGSSDMKTSAVQALELFCKLVRSDKAVRNALPRIKIENFMSMKLERHILHSFHRSEMYPGSKSAPFDALLLLTESIPDLRLENVISGKEAQDIWQRWESAKEAESLQSSFNKPSEHDDKMVSEIKLNVGQSNDVVAQIKGANMKLLRRRRRSSQIYENIVPDAKTWNSFDADILSLDEDVIDLEQELEGVVPNQENEAFELGEDGMGSDPLGIIPGIISFPESCDRSSGLSSKLNDSRPLSPHRAARKPLASPNPYVEEFDPVLFIKEKHFDTSYNDLVKGLEHLKETMVSRQTQMRTFVQAHFDHFVNCKNTIDSIQGHCIRELDSPECSKTGKLHKKIVRMHEEVNNLYRPLLEREAEASRIRNVLNSLKRFDFIFSLPGSLLYNIETEQYDKAVRDYQKFANMKETEVPFLKKVLNYVMEIVEKFRATLRSQLENPNLLLEDQERTIQ